MADIFISYNREDRATAQRFADALVAQGFDVWWDASLHAGEVFDQVIEETLRQAKAVVVLWSRHSVASRWVRAEATSADRYGTLAPVMIEDCERPIIFELTHTLDLSNWKGNIADPRWQAFAREIARLVAGERTGPEPVRIATAGVMKLPDKPSVAVLPFTDMSGAGPRDYFADGIAEEISTALSHFQSLFVIAGASSLTLRDADRDPAKICRELGVRYLLEGSVRKSGDKVRITTKLVDGIAGEQIWADRFDGALDDVFELQDRVALAVAGHMDSSIDTAELRRAATRPTNSPDAYELYWRANAMFRNWDPKSLHEAIRLAEQVLEMEPGNAWAAALAAFCHASVFSNGWSEDRMANRAAALAYYDRAMRAGGDDARVLGYCGATLISIGGDSAVATGLIDRTLAINPASATSLFWGALNDMIVGQPQRGLERMEASLRLNPLSVLRPLSISVIGTCLMQLRRFDEAARVLSEAVQHLPFFPPTLASLSASFAHAGQRAEAHAIHQRLQGVGGSIGILAALRDPEHVEILKSGLALAAAPPEQGSPA